MIPTGWRGRLIFAMSVGAVAIGLTIPALGQSVGPEIPISIAPPDAITPAVCFNPDRNEFMVVWDQTPDIDTNEVMARRVAPDGSLEPVFPVVSVTGERHLSPMVVANPIREEVLVAWEHEVPFTIGNFDTLAAVADWDGSSVGSPVVIAGGPEFQVQADAAFNPIDDEYLVVVFDLGPGWQDILAFRVDGDGTLLGGAVIASATEGRARPTAAFSPEQNAYFIGYARESWSTGDIVVAGQTAPPDLSGVSAAAESVIVDDPMDDPRNPVVGASAEGFIMLFNLPIDIRARRVGPDGQPLGPAGGFALGRQDGQSTVEPDRANAVARADDVGFVAAWHQEMSSGSDVFAQAVSPVSDRVLSRTAAIADGPADERTVDIACSERGMCLVVYRRGGDIVGRVLRFEIFSDGFDQTGDPSLWSSVTP
jgi:hypothetical protein